MTTFATGWFGTDLGPYRECGGTYDLFAADSVPPLPPLDGTFRWLPAPSEGFDYMDPAPGVTLERVGVERVHRLVDVGSQRVHGQPDRDVDSGGHALTLGRDWLPQ